MLIGPTSVCVGPSFGARGWEAGVAALEWLLIPVVGAVAAAVWAGWSCRSRQRAGDVNSLAGYERFRAAMAKSHSGGGPRA